MTNSNLHTSSRDSRVFYQKDTIHQDDQLIQFIDTIMSSKQYPVFVANSTLTEFKLLSAMRNSPLGLINCSDGDYSIVQEQENGVDYSQRESFFDLHQDGLQNNHVPDLGILFCVDPGQGTNPTLFCDTLQIVEGLAKEEPLLAALRSLEFVYLDKSGQKQIHPLLAAHSFTGKPFLNFGSRGYLRQSGVEQAPSIRNISSLLNKMFELADSATFLEHYWQKGDLVIWDNRRLLHGRGWQTKDRARRLLRLLLNRQIPVSSKETR